MIEVVLNGEVKLLKFGNYALEKYTEITGAGIGEIKEVSDDYSQLEMTADIIYCGLFGYARSKGEAMEITREQVKEWIDDVSYISQLEVIREFTNSVLKMTNDMLAAFKAMGEGEKKK
jgi:hypothetical protein